MRYVIARSEELNRERAYRIYVTDALKVSLLGKTAERYEDLFKPKDTRSAEEIVSGIRKKLGGK